LAEAIEGGEGLRFTVVEDGFCSGEPVAGFSVGEVADYVVDGPGIGAFVGEGPGFREVAKEGVKGGGCAGEE
jgi:hypothetical protein